MKIHFIAIGGSAMHNLALALKEKGEVVTGSDDEIFEPSKTRLQNRGLLPEEIGWKDNHYLHDLTCNELSRQKRGLYGGRAVGGI